MTATNHAVTGALIGLSVHNAPLALGLAVVSHFVLDALPHFDMAGTKEDRIASRAFSRQLLLDASMCGLLVLTLFMSGHSSWFLASVCAFLATSPDFMWMPQYIRVQKGQESGVPTDPLRRFHSWIQWKTGANLWWVELLWLVSALVLLWNILR